MTLPYLFLVRLWRSPSVPPGQTFRASVRRVDSEEAQLFSRAEDVARYLDEQARAPVGSGEPVPVDPGSKQREEHTAASAEPNADASSNRRSP